MTTINDVREAYPHYFSEANKRFFRDISYNVIKGKKLFYLVTHTNKFSGMAGGVKKPVYVLKPLGETPLKIGRLIEKEFETLDDVKTFLGV